MFLIDRAQTSRSRGTLRLDSLYYPGKLKKQKLYSSKIVTLCDLLFRKREAKSTVMLTIVLYLL